MSDAPVDIWGGIVTPKAEVLPPPVSHDTMQRVGFLGGSDHNDIYDLPPYGCSRKLWYEKRGVAADYPREETPAMLRGKRFEPFVVDEWVLRHGGPERARVRAYAPSDRAAGLPEWWGGTPDRIVETCPGTVIIRRDVDGSISNLRLVRGDVAILEAKTATRWVLKAIIEGDGLPKGYIMQLQHYMRLTGAAYGEWAVLDIDTMELYCVRIDRDERLLRAMTAKGFAFWVTLQGDTPPDGWLKRHAEDDSPCGRCEYRFSCLGPQIAAEEEMAALRRYQLRGRKPPVIEHHPELEALLAERDKLKDIGARAGTRVEEIDSGVAVLLNAIGATDGAVIAGRPVVYRERQGSQSVDRDALRKLAPDVAAKVITRGAPSRWLDFSLDKVAEAE